jgi:hypothetical protein
MKDFKCTTQGLFANRLPRLIRVDVASRLATIIRAFLCSSTGDETKLEFMENKMLLADIPHRAGSASGPELGARAPIGHELQQTEGGVR